MDYKGRIGRLRAQLYDNRLDGIFISPDANWEYIAGVPRLESGNTKQRQNSMEYTGLLVTEDEVIAFIPRLSSLGIVRKIKDYSWITRIVIFEDNDLSGTTFVNVCRELKLQNKRLGIIQDVSSTVVLKLQSELGASFMNVDSIIQGMRSRKDAEEIILMKEASNIADRIFYDILGQLKVGVTIREVEMEIDRLTEKFGAAMTSFPTTVYQHGVKSGKWTGDNNPVIEKGHVIAFDYGVVYKGYCSDFGRNIFVGEPDDEQLKIHNIIMKSQKMGIDLLKPGCTGQDVNAKARKVIEDEGYKDNFYHRLGHGIGMDVHERPFLAEADDRVIDVGMTFTVEPSIFLPGKCLIRVEDVVLVTENEAEVLNKASKEIHVI